MKVLAFLILLLVLPSVVHAQTKFRLNDASKFVDVELAVGDCRYESFEPCGPLKVAFFRKGVTRSFQTITIRHTQMWDAEPKANITRRYDEQAQ